MTKRFLSRGLFFFLFVLSIVPNNSQAQKKSLNKDAFESWISLGNASISSDGKYIFYIIKNQPKGSSTLVVTLSNKKKDKRFIEVSAAFFTSDSKRLCFIKGQDSLVVLDLESFHCSYIENVKEFSLVGTSPKEWLIYQTSRKELLIKNIETEKEFLFKNVNSYKLNDSGNVVVFEKANNSINGSTELIWFNLEVKQQHAIWTGKKVLGYVISPNGYRCAFLTEDSSGIKANRQIYVYTAETNSTELLTISLKNGFLISDEPFQFNFSGENLYFSFERTSDQSVKQNMVSVDVWNYKDAYLQTEQLRRLSGVSGSIKYKVVYNISTNHLIEPHRENDYVQYSNSNRYALINTGALPQWYYNSRYWPSLTLIDLENGTRKTILNKSCSEFANEAISPDDKFLVWFDYDKLCWFSYEIKSGEIKSISANIPCAMYDENALKIGKKGTWGMVGWITSEDAIFLYDRYDIWKVFIDNRKPPINITNGVGRKSDIILNIISDNIDYTILNSSSKLVVAGYSMKTKEGGYYQMRLGEKFGTEQLNLQPYSITSRMPVGSYRKANGRIIKAKDRDAYIVFRESAEESQNIFFTTDFKTYAKISEINPEKDYNWLTAELITWKMLDGQMSQGILYKPGNFDITRRYPIIINYYEKRSDEFHEFLLPNYSQNEINIPSFIDNGYLVFVPDIYSSPGKVGEGSYNAIESAAIYLSKLPYVDSTKLGLQGHSYGGWQTNFMITHSRRFAAACEAAGASDHVSGYGQLLGNGGSRAEFYEIGLQGSPYGLGVTPWSNPDFYITNSPVFKIDRITTPLLIMHNKNDGAVPFEQAVELFTGMERAGKKVWMLQYDNQGHSVTRNDAEDYHTRMLQFFNYYLKGSQAPVWMTQGVAAKDKGIKSGLELDTTGAIP
jgi:dienelactone hydrolase